MSIITQIKKELKNLGIKPKKGLGQNFLINESVYKKILSALEIEPEDTIVEVGPGLGTLTEYLAETGAKVIAVEKDHRLVGHLRQKFQNNSKVEIIEEDILRFDPIRYTLNAKRFKIVGNIPYYLTSHLLHTVFENWPRPESVVLTVQKEVAQRIVAKPPRMSLLAVSVQYYAEPKIISYVSRKSFWPEPEVDSAIIKLVSSDPEAEPSVRDGTGWRLATSANPNSKFKIQNSHNTKKFFSIVRSGFAGKRKTLANNLARGLKLPKKITEEKLESAVIDPRRRAETLTLEEWQTLAKIF